MQESKMYQLYRRRAIRENTIKHISAVIETKFSAEIARALAPIIEKIDDLQRLEELHTAAVKAQNIEAFTQILSE